MSRKHTRVRRNTDNLTNIVVGYNSYAKVEEGREKVTAKGDVTRITVSGSRTSETETELLSVDVEDPRVAEDTADAGSECTQKAMEVSTKKKKTKQEDNPHRWMRKLVESGKQRNGGNYLQWR